MLGREGEEVGERGEDEGAVLTSHSIRRTKKKKKEEEEEEEEEEGGRERVSRSSSQENRVRKEKELLGRKYKTKTYRSSVA